MRLTSKGKIRDALADEDVRLPIWEKNRPV